MKDFIIVGHGLAAHVLMHNFHKHGISFTAIGTQSLSSCSRVAAGIWNPVVFKRATKSWLAEDLIASLNEFYESCEADFGERVITQRPIIKPFVEEQEKQLWIKKAQGELKHFTDPVIHNGIGAALRHCKINNGYGSVKQSGNLNVARFIDLSAVFFKDFFLNEAFDYQQLRIGDDKITYKTIEARSIIFCEGYRVKDNPFFNWIPLKPAKGEILTIRAPQLAFKDLIFNKNGFIMDVANGEYKVGATYGWDDLSETPSPGGLTELREKTGEMIDCDYTVSSHEAGIRPSSIDRRPVIGAHPHHKRLFIFNGLGTKGVMLAPYFANKFVNFYLQKEPMHKEVMVERFYRLYEA